MVYLHVPFCKSFCTYCDFYSEICSPWDSARVQNLFVDRVCEEIDRRRDEIAAAADVRTLYVGGGTPSLLPADALGRIVRHLDGGPYDEFTVEVNPDDIVAHGEDYVSDLLGLGVGRFSMGVQSMDDGILKWMNRRHDSAEAAEAFRILRAGGVDNISVDLIFGLSQVSLESWRDTVGRILELRPEHISAYQLSIEDGSALAGMVRSGRYAEATQEHCREQYDLLCRMLHGAGYEHYEVSNFALPGREAVHNSAYWTRSPYVGLGPGAHSFDGRSRSWNSQSLTAYSREFETLSPEDVRIETLMLGLRTSRGLDEAAANCLADAAALADMISEGALVHSPGGRLRIPEDRFFVSDDIIRALI